MSKNKSNTIRPHHFLFSIVPGAVLILLLSASELPGLVTDPSIGARQNLEDLNLVQIDTLYGSRRVYTDMEYNYRVRVKDNATWPIRYDWTIDEEIQTSGNNIVHQFTRPGK